MHLIFKNKWNTIYILSLGELEGEKEYDKGIYYIIYFSLTLSPIQLQREGNSR